MIPEHVEGGQLSSLEIKEMQIKTNQKLFPLTEQGNNLIVMTRDEKGSAG